MLLTSLLLISSQLIGWSDAVFLCIHYVTVVTAMIVGSVNLLWGSYNSLLFGTVLQAFEDSIRKNRTVLTNWLKYAAWEESQQELQRYSHSLVSCFMLFV